jgi:hypothetical protein
MKWPFDRFGLPQFSESLSETEIETCLLTIADFVPRSINAKKKRVLADEDS